MNHPTVPHVSFNPQATVDHYRARVPYGHVVKVKHLGATNYKGSRVSISCRTQCGATIRKELSFDHEFNVDQQGAQFIAAAAAEDGKVAEIIAVVDLGDAYGLIVSPDTIPAVRAAIKRRA